MPWDTAERDDLVQEALVRYLQRIRSVDITSPRAYLTTTIMHLASTHRRRWVRRNQARARIGPVSEAVGNEYPSDLADLDRLSPMQRAILYLHDVDGRTFDDVAELVGCSPAAARKAAERARHRLSRELEEEST